MAAVFRLGDVILLPYQRFLMRLSPAKWRVDLRAAAGTLRVPV